MDEKKRNDDITFRFYQKIATFSELVNSKLKPSGSEASREFICNKMVQPLEQYLLIPANRRHDFFFKNIQLSDVVLGKVTAIFGSKVSIRLLSVLYGQQRWIGDLHIMADALLSGETNGSQENLEVGDCVTGIVMHIDKRTKEIHLSFSEKDLNLKQTRFFPLGKFDDELDKYESELIRDNNDGDFENSGLFLEDVQRSQLFNNPHCVQLLAKHHNVDQRNATLLKVSKELEESVESLRDKQSYKWSMSMVGEGVKHFREKNLKEALKCFDQAISHYPNNVEGFVARGALKANRNELKEAVEDFRQALQINPNHRNGKKYLIETSLSIARSCEKEKQWKNASRCYQEILKFETLHKEANDRYHQIRQILSHKIVTGKEKDKPLVSGNSGTYKISKLKELLMADRRKHNNSSSSSSDSSSSSSSDSENSSSSEWVEKPRTKEIKNKKRGSSHRGELSTVKDNKIKIGENKHSDPTINSNTHAFAQKLKHFSSEDLTIVTKLLETDTEKKTLNDYTKKEYNKSESNKMSTNTDDSNRRSRERSTYRRKQYKKYKYS